MEVVDFTGLFLANIGALLKISSLKLVYYITKNKEQEEILKWLSEKRVEVIQNNEEIEDVNLIKKIKKKNRRKALGIFVGAFILSGVLMGVGFHLTHGVAMYENVILNYGVQGDTAYLTLQGKPGYELNFSGATDENKSSLKVMYARNIWGNDKNMVRLEGESNRSGEPHQWILEFKDRIIVIENGELVDEKIK